MRNDSKAAQRMEAEIVGTLYEEGDDPRGERERLLARHDEMRERLRAMSRKSTSQAAEQLLAGLNPAERAIVERRRRAKPL